MQWRKHLTTLSAPSPVIHQKDWFARTRVVPRQELREEGVVVCQRLARGSGSGRGLASSGEVGELVGRLCGLVLDVLGDRA